MASSAYQVFSDTKFLLPPVKRAAYSDRMALLMAEMSKLAYLPFKDLEEPGQTQEGRLARLIEGIRSSPSTDEARKVLEDFLLNVPATGTELSRELDKASYRLVNTYDLAGTQAFLAARDPRQEPLSDEEGIAVLSFRGTEKDVRDVKTDLKASKSMVNGVPVHTGFWDAFKRVQFKIQSDLTPLLERGYALYLTGHSLGGALALIATREIGNDSVGACYTFGSPRVAGYGFAQDIKTPIYRVVNANDVVPRLPPAILPHILLFIVSVLPIPGQKWLTRLLDKFVGYVHHGDMRYLMRSKGEGEQNYEDVRLLSNPNMLHRLRWFIIGWLKDFKSPVKDHAIDTYCRKLKAYALKRNL